MLRVVHDCHGPAAIGPTILGAFLPEVQAGIDLLDAMHGAPEELDWFYVAPATGFGSWAPGEATGRYRTSQDVLLVD